MRTLPLKSANPRCLPAVEKAWHGGPPTSNVTSLAPTPAVSRISDDNTLFISFSMTGMSVLRRIVLAAHLSISTQTLMSKPDFSMPRSRPIAPENRDMALYFIIVSGYVQCKVNHFCLCLTASKSRTAADTETLRESRRPSMGMRMWASAARRQMSLSPVSSAPITRAVPRRMSQS